MILDDIRAAKASFRANGKELTCLKLSPAHYARALREAEEACVVQQVAEPRPASYGDGPVFRMDGVDLIEDQSPEVQP